MAFHTGNYTMAGFIAEMAADLVATDDFEMIDTEAMGSYWEAGFCIRYIPDDIYITIAKTGKGGSSTTMTTRCRSDTVSRYVGLTFLFSTGYDLATHTPTGTVYAGAAPLFGYENYSSSSGYYDNTKIGDMATFPITYYADRFGVIAAIENPTPDLPSVARGLYFVLEFIPEAARIYDDGLSSIFYHCKPAAYREFVSWSDTAHVPQSYLNLRVFGQFQNTSLVNIWGSAPAFRSAADGKVYFGFPFCFHGTGVPTNPMDTDYSVPMHHSRRFLYANPKGGFAAGDAISWTDTTDPANPVERSFILAGYRGVDNSDDILVGIPYGNPYQYPEV